MNDYSHKGHPAEPKHEREGDDEPSTRVEEPATVDLSRNEVKYETEEICALIHRC